MYSLTPPRPLSPAQFNLGVMYATGVYALFSTWFNVQCSLAHQHAVMKVCAGRGVCVDEFEAVRL
jgi:hypothetical protein